MEHRRMLGSVLVVALSGATGVASELGRSGVTPGLEGRYFKLGFSPTSLDQVDFGVVPSDVVIDPQIGFLATLGEFRPGLTDYVDRFAVEWRGLIRIDQPGEIDFTTRGDDASRLYIDGTMVAETDFHRGITSGAGAINLSAGYHHFRMTYMENEGMATCLLRWDVGAGQELVPPEVLFTPEPATLSLLAFGGLCLARRGARRTRRVG